MVRYDYLAKTYKLIKNWYDVILFRLGIKKKIKIILRDGREFAINNFNDYRKFWLEKVAKINVKTNEKYIEFPYDGKNIKMFYSFPVDTCNIVNEVFFDNVYKFLEVKNKIVVDIGANVGDSAIYFALNGAKHVYAFEPYLFSYNLAVRNAKENNLGRKITIIRAGCGESNTIKLDSDYRNFGGSDISHTSKNGIKTKIYSLKQIVDKFKIKNNAVLKIDCEGCEYGVILNADKNTLKRFDRIQIEYHYGYKNLVKKLKDSGFEVKYSWPKTSANYVNPQIEMFVGFIYAKRKDNNKNV